MAKITGTEGEDYLTGTAESDEMRGLEQRDYIDGGTGDDFLYGGDGDDYLTGGAGHDLAEGGEGNDRLYGGSGSDILRGEGGDDVLEFRQDFANAADSPTLSGGLGRDVLRISLSGDVSSAVLDGGDGDDTVELDSSKGAHLITLGTGTDTLSLGGFHGTGEGRTVTVTDFVTGSAGDRMDLSRFLRFSLNYWESQSPFDSGHLKLIQSGADTILQFDRDGAEGGEFGLVTLVRFKNTESTAFTWENLDGFNADGTIPAGLEITGTAGSDLLVGAAGNDVIDGLGGANELWGGSGGDRLTGGDDRDYLYGEEGDDTLIGGGGDDVLDPGRGKADVRAGEGNDYIYSEQSGDHFLLGEGGNDNIQIQRSFGGADSVMARGGEGDDRFQLFAYGYHVFFIEGDAGNDEVRIGWLQGNAIITLGEGSDTLILDDTQNVLLQYGAVTVVDFAAGAGGDKIALADWLSTILVGWDQAENPFGTGHLQLIQDGQNALLQVDRDAEGDVYGFRTAVTLENRQAADFDASNFGGYAPDGSSPAGLEIIGTPAGETLVGGAGGDRIEGGGGYDTLKGEGGNDSLSAVGGGGSLSGGAGNDTLTAGDWGDILNGDSGDDIVQGGLGRDSISLGDGSDTAHGGDGADNLYFYQTGQTGKTSTAYGENGADTFVLRAYNVAHFVADGGADNDLFAIAAIAGTASVTLGSGSDRVYLEGDFFNAYVPGAVTITDFEAGASGDFLDLPVSGNALLTNFIPGSNPFASGHLRLVQSGADTLVQMDRNGGGDALETIITLKGVHAADLILANLGVASLGVYGTAGADQLRAGAGTNVLIGRAGDDVYVVESFADTVTEVAGEGTDRVETALGSRTDYSQLYILPAFVENFTGTSAAGQGVRGNALDNAFVMGVGNDLVVLDDGGRDSVSGGAGNDFFYYGAAFGAGDTVNGGAGTDSIGLLGSYNLTLAAGALVGIEQVSLYTGQPGSGGTAYSYTLTTHDSNVAAGQELSVYAGSLAASETLIFNGSAETDGRLKVLGGRGSDIIAGGAKVDYLAGDAGSDSLYGMAGNDTLYGGAGGDMLNGGLGSDHFQYRSATESTGTGFDRLMLFDSKADRIDLPTPASGWTGKVSGSLSTAGFDASLAAAVDSSLQPFSAVLFRADAGEFQGRTFAVVDANGDGSYQAGQDYVLEFVNPVQPLDTALPIFV